jgi:hypothetical protein
MTQVSARFRESADTPERNQNPNDRETGIRRFRSGMSDPGSVRIRLPRWLPIPQRIDCGRNRWTILDDLESSGDNSISLCAGLAYGLAIWAAMATSGAGPDVAAITAAAVAAVLAAAGAADAVAIVS